MGEASQPTEKRAPPQATPCLCSSLRRAARAATRHYDQALRPSGLSISQFDLLSTLSGHMPLSVGALADLLAMERSTLSRDLNPLERDGLVELQVGQDRRSRLVSLTPHGLEVLSGAGMLWQRAQTELAELLGHGQVQTLMGDLREVVSALQES